ncbi:MAG: diphosphatase [Actinomycetota bacterium]|nr:diphosphatase [Actinomycetota bacterium]
MPLLHAPGPPEGTSLLIAVRGNQVVVSDADPDPGSVAIFLGTLAGRHCWAIDADDAGWDAGAEVFADLRTMFGALDEQTWTVAGRAVQLVEWARTHRFCGRCGTPTEEKEGERARICPSCKLMAFPRLAPAVIMLVERDDGRALLARNALFPAGMFSCLAGFVEPGETLEDAVRREVMEEVAIVVGDLDYRGSQPWPFPHQLMIGFGAKYVSGEITVDGVEIAEADWFAPDALPSVPPGNMSIAGRLINGWIQRHLG